MSDEVKDEMPSSCTYPLLIKQLLHTPLAHAPSQEIVYQGRVRMTYAQFKMRIAQLANGLQKLGVQKGMTVAVMDWDSHRYLECYFTVPMMGAILQTVNVRLSPAEIAYTINHAQADVLLVHSDFLPIVESLRDKLETVRTMVLIDEEGAGSASPKISFAQEYEALIASSCECYDFPDFDENTRATTFYTTGTTGLPKGVYFSHRQLVLHTLSVMAALAGPESGQRFHRGDVYMPLTPMFHVHAWGMPYIATLMGVKQVYPGRYMPERIVKLIRNEGVTFSHCVGTILHMLLRCPEAPSTDFSKWKVVIGGSPLSQGLASEALAHGIDVFTGYGMSETCPVLTLAQLKPHGGPVDTDEALRLRCKTGLPVPLVDLRIVDESMRDVPRDGSASGEIVVRAPTQGYLNNPEASTRLWTSDYLHTQDVARIGTDGFVQITDRIKDVIKSGGEWISSLEIESLISTHPAVAEVAVVGISDEKWGERPAVLVVPRKDSATPITEEDIRRHVLAFSEKGLISKYAVPQVVKFVDALEKTSVGKLNKNALRERLSS